MSSVGALIDWEDVSFLYFFSLASFPEVETNTALAYLTKEFGVGIDILSIYN